MPTLPIVERELRVASRHPRIYRARLVASIIALCLFGYVSFVSTRVRTAFGTGQQVFLILTQFAFFYCLFSGLGQTSDCLSREKREGTLGLLFLTDLKGYDVVFGKLFAASLTSVYGLMATFPVLAIPLLMGGVQAGQFWRMVLSLANALFFSLSAGLLVSAISRNAVRAGNAASILVLFFGLGIPVLGEWMRVNGYPSLGFGLSLFSPAYSQGMGVSQTGSPSIFWWSLLAVNGLSWVFLGLTCWIVPHVWQDRVSRAKTGDGKTSRMTVSSAKFDSGKEFRTRLLNLNPFYWLAARKRFKPIGTWMLLAGIVLLIAGVWLAFPTVVDPTVMLVITAVLFHLVIKVEVASAACRRFAEERENGTFEFLLATPIRVSEILKGQWMALRRHFLWPVVTVLTGCFLMFLYIREFDPSVNLSSTEIVETWLPLVLGTSVMLVADVIGLGWAGMWAGISVKQMRQASGSAGFRILLLPWFVVVMIVTPYGIMGAPGAFRPAFWHFVSLWFVIGIVNNLIFVHLSRSKLKREFRVRAVERFKEEPEPWFYRLKSLVKRN